MERSAIIGLVSGIAAATAAEALERPERSDVIAVLNGMGISLDEGGLNPMMPQTAVPETTQEAIAERSAADFGNDVHEEDLEQEVVAGIEAREQAYAQQEDKAVPAKSASKRTKKAQNVDESVEAAPKPKQPRGRVGDKCSEQIRHVFGNNDDALADNLTLLMSEAGKPKSDRLASINELLNSIDGAAKKVGEKAVNLVYALQGKQNLSSYTKIAFQLLAAKGEVTASDIKNEYLAVPYSAGTAAAQTSQMMLLFPMLGIASRDKSKLTFNKDSVLGAALADALA